MSLSLSRITQAWGSSLAVLEPIPEDKLDILLRVCVEDGFSVVRAKDAVRKLRSLHLYNAGEVLQRALPLSRFLEKARGKHTNRVVTGLVRLLEEFPHAWEALQNGPLQTQADFTQLMLDLRKVLRDASTPPAARQQLSKSVLQLLQQLFQAASKQQAAHSKTWVKTGCNLLLRALTRSQQFVRDPMLPLLPVDAHSMLVWLKESLMGAADLASSACQAPTADMVGSSTAGAAGTQQPVTKLVWKDDKFYLLVTKLVMTATGLLPEEALAAAAAAAYQESGEPVPPSAEAAAAANGRHAVGTASNGPQAKVGWVPHPNGNGVARSSALDPQILCDLLEWSSTKVKLALQQLLGHGGSADAAPSREAATASAQLAATCIHTLRAGPHLRPELEQKLSRQVEELLEIALAVGEAAVASAAVADRASDSDKVLALGARVLSATTPFVAASASRSSLEQQLELISRLQQLMLAAARLAGRHSAAAAVARISASGPAVAWSTSGRVSAGGTEHLGDPQGHQRHHNLSHRPHRTHSNLGSKLRASVSRLASRKAHRKQGFAGFGALGRRGSTPPQFYRQANSPVPSKEPSYWAGAGVPPYGATSTWQQQQAITLGLEDGLGLGEEMQRQLLVADSEPSPAPEDLAHPWSWDVTQPLTVLSEGIKLAQLPLSCGIGGFLLARAAAEALGDALAASWSSGSAAPVRCMMLLPQIGAAEQMVTVLALGRLYVKLSADPTLGQLLLPLLADVLSRSSTECSGLASYSSTPRVHTTSQTLSTGGAVAGPASAASVANGYQEAVRCPRLSTADVAGAVVCALEGMASACVQLGRDTWLYDQALQLLLMMYREPTAVSLQLLTGRTASPATAGLLADALHLLAVGLEDAPHRARQELRTKLLLLFTDVAASVGGGSGIVTADLGDLLVAVAVAAEGLQPRTVRLLGGSSSNRMSIHDIQTAQREDASTTRLFRSLWLYTAAYKLVNPAAGLSAGGGGSSGNVGGSAQEWQVAAGRLAAVTPLLVVGTDSYHEADMVERLKVELDEQLSQVGSLGSSSSLSTVLISLLGGKAALEGLNLPQPTEAVLVAFIVAVALAELSRAALGPLPDLDDDPVVSCPISVTLGYLKGVLPDGVAAAWVGAIVKRAARLYINRLLALAARQEQEEEDEGGMETASTGQPLAPALAYAEQLACALIANLAGGLGSGTATEGTSAPVVAALADELLFLLLEAFPALLHSQLCYCALLVQLQKEEGDIPMGKVQAADRGLVWERTKSWVQAAAEVAPMTTEALLHSFLTSSDSLPGATPPAWLADGRQDSPQPAAGAGGLEGGSASSDSMSLLDGATAGSLIVAGGKQARVATQAAFRRAADLLQTCGAARRRLQMGQAGNGAYDGALGLTRKLHYTGYVQGLMVGRGSAAAAAAMLAQSRGQHFSGKRSTAAISGCTAAAGATEMIGGTALQSVAAASDSGADGPDGSESEASEQTQMAVAEEIATQLELALQQSSPRGAHLAVALLSATALLAVQPDAFSYSQLGMRLLGALARAPLRHLTPDTMRLGRFSWCWVTVESPEVLVPLISSLGSAWVWTLDQRVGLFSGLQHQLTAEGDATAGGGHAIAPSEEDAPVVHDESMLQALSAHFLWLSYLTETWAVVSRLRDSRTAAARTVYGRLLAASLQDPFVLSHHPAAVGAYFRLLTLGLQYGRSCLRSAASAAAGRGGLAAGADVLLLFDRVLQAALLWFKSPPRYFARCTRQAAAEQLAALEAFMAELTSLVAYWTGGRKSVKKRYPSYDPSLPAAAQPVGSGGQGHAAAAAVPHPVWGDANPDVSAYVELLQFLCGEELARLKTWTEPLRFADASRITVAVPWRQYACTAWQVNPALALSLLDHFPAVQELRASLEALVIKHAAEPRVQFLPRAALLLATAKCPNKHDILRYLASWTPGTAAQGLQLLSGPEGRQVAVRSYAVKCLFNERPEKLVFFLPQLVQLLRGDADGVITNFFLTSAAHSDLFGHQLIWALSSEAKPPEEAFNPEVKRSGWQPPKDTGLWDIAARVRSQIEAQMTPAQQEYWQAEGGYFQQVTELSGYLYKFSKDERRVKLQEALTKFQPPRSDLYIPTNPEARVTGHIPSSGACMQSAAKVPILVAFNVDVPAPGATAGHDALTVPAKMACIFKVGDDIRQDVLAIQVIKLLHNAFEAAGLSLYLRPYGCLPTGYECGVIEVVPNTKSRAALGELSDRGLHDIFTAEFGAPGSPAFERARENFIVSEAAYAVASYLLQAKDRHNGNIMLDDQGHIVHIDFGFILEISPGGNMGFESAAFKLSHEMTQVLDPGGRRTSPQLALFEELVVRAYLAARTVAEPIIATVSLMADSGLPCFSRGAPVANLRQRFHLEMSDAQAAAFMRAQIADAYDKWTTGFYDYIQSLQNKIPY